MLFVASREDGTDTEPRRVPILFIEADGVMVGCQGMNQKNLEIKLGVVHEGWEEIGKRRKLKNPHIVASSFMGGDQFLETLTAQLTKLYDL